MTSPLATRRVAPPPSGQWESCPACGATNTRAGRWCDLCDANLTDPDAAPIAPVWKRIVAGVLDSAAPAFGLFGRGVLTSASAAWSLRGVIVVAYIIGSIVLFTQGTSPGKSLLRLRVVRADGTRAGLGTMILREWIGKTISSLVFYLGYVSIAFDANRQGFHDKIAKTFVVDES